MHGWTHIPVHSRLRWHGKWVDAGGGGAATAKASPTS